MSTTQTRVFLFFRLIFCPLEGCNRVWFFKPRGKNNNSTKGKGKSFVPPGAKRFAFGRRNQGRDSTTSSTSARSTTSGSTSSHGPRFKRYRLPASGIKEVPDEANMVTELDVTDLEVQSNVMEEIHYNGTESGWAIMDSGATKTAGVGHLKRICKDAFSVAGAVQETFSSELLGGQGADFLREVAFWSIRSLGLLRWFRVTGTALRMTWHHFFVAGAVLSTGGLEKSQNALVRGRQRCSQLSIFEGSLAELLRFWCCQVWKMRKSRRIASFLTLLSSKIEEVSQNCFVFDAANFEKWRHLAELLRFQACK